MIGELPGVGTGPGGGPWGGDGRLGSISVRPGGGDNSLGSQTVGPWGGDDGSGTPSALHNWSTGPGVVPATGPGGGSSPGLGNDWSGDASPGDWSSTMSISGDWGSGVGGDWGDSVGVGGNWGSSIGGNWSGGIGGHWGGNSVADMLLGGDGLDNGWFLVVFDEGLSFNDVLLDSLGEDWGHDVLAVHNG